LFRIVGDRTNNNSLLLKSNFNSRLCWFNPHLIQFHMRWNSTFRSLIFEVTAFQLLFPSTDDTHFCPLIHPPPRTPHFAILSGLRNLLSSSTLGGWGLRGSTVVKVLCYKSEGRWFDPRWYQ